MHYQPRCKFCIELMGVEWTCCLCKHSMRDSAVTRVHWKRPVRCFVVIQLLFIYLFHTSGHINSDCSCCHLLCSYLTHWCSNGYRVIELWQHVDYMEILYEVSLMFYDNVTLFLRQDISRFIVIVAICSVHIWCVDVKSVGETWFMFLSRWMNGSHIVYYDSTGILRSECFKAYSKLVQ